MEGKEVRGIRFLFDSQFRACLFKAVIIRKGNVAYNTKPAGKDGKFIDIAEIFFSDAYGVMRDASGNAMGKKEGSGSVVEGEQDAGGKFVWV